MTQIEVPFDEKTLREVLFGDKDVEVLLENVMNEMMEAELTEHIGAEPGEQTLGRRGYRNGHYKRKLTTRVGTLELEGPRDRDGTFSGRAVRALSKVREGTGSGTDADGDRELDRGPCNVTLRYLSKADRFFDTPSIRLSPR